MMNLKLSLLIVLFMSLVSCNTSKKTNVKLSKEEQQTYMDKGNDITQKAFKLLGKNLISQMQQGGPSQALPFCNVQAIPLTEIIATQEKVQLKRVSRMYRNSANKPNATELHVISDYESDLLRGKKLAPVLISSPEGKPQFFAPIFINKKCLACHGVIHSQVSKKTDSLIKALYPNDLATGYKVGDLRGIWSVQF